MQIAVIIAAAGASRRYLDSAKARGEEALRSKLDEDLGGRPVLQRSVELFVNHPLVQQTIVAGPADADEFAAFKLRHSDKLTMLGAKLIQGGAEHRYQTVKLALAQLAPSITHIAVHDAARPACPPALIERLFELAQHHKAVIPALPVSDTLKRAGPPIKSKTVDPLAGILGESGTSSTPLWPVKETVDRASLYAVQTPQVFERGLLERAYAQSDLTSTDDSQLIERLIATEGGNPVMLTPGDGRNLKLTTRSDLDLIRAILNIKGSESRSNVMRF
jgi:2-C-methyl-D-erythritol 4-phosphate cytidylyltransferase